jgi:general secretion pathway protein L
MIERMRGTTRLGLVLLADRVAAAVVRGGRVVDSFAIVEAEHPAESLRAELDARGVKPRVARLGIERSAVVVKAIDLPAAVNGNLGQMVQFELARHVPFPADDAAFAFAPLPGAANGQRVLIVASERRTIDRVLQLLAETKIRPVSLAVAPHELVSLLGRRPRGERAVWIHRVGDHADLLLVAGNTLVASRSVGATEPAALATDVRGSLGMVRWSECDALWVSGDEAGRLEDAPALGALGLPIDAPPLSSRARRALGEVAETGDGAALLAAAVATGARGPALDLLPAGLRPRRLRREQKVTIAMAALTVLLGVGWLFGQDLRDQQRLARVEAEIRRLDPEVRSAQRLMDALERQRRLLASAHAIGAASLKPLPLLRELTETLPPDVWLTTLTLDQKGVEMTGQAATASALIPLLENSPRLEHVEFASPVTRGQDKEQFRIRASWEAGPGTAPAKPAATVAPAPRRPVPGAPPRGEIRPRGPAPGSPVEGGTSLPPPPPMPAGTLREDH